MSTNETKLKSLDNIHKKLTEPNYAEIRKEAEGVLELDSKNKVALKFIAMCDENKRLKEESIDANEVLFQNVNAYQDIKAANTLLREECRILAMLASDKPKFTNPTVVAAAKNLRDRILKGNNV